MGQRPIAVENQSKLQAVHARYIENQRWQMQGVVFATLHIVGSNNNFEIRDPMAVREFFERDAANVAWLESTFEQARRTNAEAVVLAFQADMFETRNAWEDYPAWSGFRRVIGESLLPLARQWGKPVLVVHGDSHQFRIDQPFTLDKKPLANVTRLIVPGERDVRAVQVRVQARLLEGEAAKDALLKQLIGDHEPPYAAQWRALPEDYTERMLQGIVAFELDVVDLQCAVKLNQHRPEAHAAMHRAYTAGSHQEQALAQWMQRLGMV